VPVDIWTKLKTAIPYSNSSADVEKRKELWKKLDANVNGQLSLIEVGKGLRETLGLPELAEAKVALKDAFDAAKNKVKGATKSEAHNVSEAEFRYLLFYLEQYFEYWVAFNRVDSNPDHKITLIEFKAAAPNFAKWGVKVEDAEATFKQIDANHSGAVTFSEFVKWASNKNLDLDDDDNNPKWE
jgi:Ca2+-binding EF-hand superfamily protein